MEQFFITDIHGNYKLLEKALKYWDKDTQQLNFLGDYMDRGKNSKEVLLKVHDLVKNHGAKAIKGNHDAMFLHYLEFPWNGMYVHNGGLDTINSLLDMRIRKSHYLSMDMEETQEMANRIKCKYEEEISFLRELPYWIEGEHFIGVHAGINLNEEDWKESGEDYFMWVREDYYSQRKNPTGKTIVSGHTPTLFLGNEDGSVLDIGEHRYLIDSGNFRSKKLNVFILKNNGDVKEYFQVCE